MKNIFFKRATAYLIDIFLITIISFIITQIPYINPNYDNYKSTANKIVNLEEKYKNKKISKEKYLIEYQTLNKKQDIYSFPYTLITTAFLFGYFVLFQYYNDGRTLGKKLMKLRIKSYNNKKLKFINYFIRGLLINSIFVNVVDMLWLFTTPSNIYYSSTNILSIVESIFMYTTIVIMLFRRDNRGLHDIICNTKVIEENNN